MLDVAGQVVPAEVLDRYDPDTCDPALAVFKRTKLFESDEELTTRTAVTDRLAALHVPVAPVIRALDGSAWVRDATGTAYLVSQRLISRAGPIELAGLSTWSVIGHQLGVLHTALAECDELAGTTFSIDPVKVMTGTVWDTLVNTGTLGNERLVRINQARLAAAVADLPVTRLHGDCHGGNLLADSEGLYGVIDIDHLPVGPRVCDLASYAADLLRNRDSLRGRVVAIIAAVIAGYHRHTALTAREVLAIVPAMITYELGMIHWFIGETGGEHQQIHLEVLDSILDTTDDLTMVLLKGRRVATEPT